MTHEITVTVDCNDGDELIRISTITDEKLAELMPLIIKIKNFEPYKTTSKSGSDWTHGNNYPTGDCLRDDLGQLSPSEHYGVSEELCEEFEEYCNHGEYGFHTVCSITISPIVDKKELL